MRTNMRSRTGMANETRTRNGAPTHMRRRRRTSLRGRRTSTRLITRRPRRRPIRAPKSGPHPRMCLRHRLRT